MIEEIFTARLIKTRAVRLGIITKIQPIYRYIIYIIFVGFNDSLQYNFNLCNLYVIASECNVPKNNCRPF